MAVVLSDLLHESQVILALADRTREGAVREIIATMSTPAPVRDREKFIAEVLAREETHSTFMGNGVAFPHARTDCVEEIVLGIGRSAEGVAFGENGELAQLIFVIGVPKRMVTDYLVCVGALARLTKDEETRRALMDAESAAALIEILRAGSLLLS